MAKGRSKGMSKEVKTIITSILIFGAGAVIAYASLILNQQYPVMLSLGSIVSPTGGQATIAGLRIKHWLVGAVLLVFAVALYFKDSKNTLLKHVCIAMAGAGVFLVVDETNSVLCTATTWQYPCADSI